MQVTFAVFVYLVLKQFLTAGGKLYLRKVYDLSMCIIAVIYFTLLIISILTLQLWITIALMLLPCIWHSFIDMLKHD